MTSCANAGQSAVLSSDAPQSVRSPRRVPTVAQCTGREHVAEEPSRATNGEDRNLGQRCAIHAARQLGLPNRWRSADKLSGWKTITASVRGTDAAGGDTSLE